MKTLILTQKNRLKTNLEQLEVLRLLSYHYTRLYNVGLYSVRQYYFSNNEYLPYAANYHTCKTNENYKLLLSDMAQHALRLVDRNFRSFFQLLKLKQQGKYSAKIRLPRYKQNFDLMTISIQGRSARVKNGYVYIGLSKAFKDKYKPSFKEFVFKLPKNVQVTKLQEVRLVPVFNGLEFDIEYVYQKEIVEHQLDTNNYLSIDMGLDNFATCFNSNDGSSFIIDGRYIKSVNHHYNKTKAALQSIYTKQHISNNTKRMLRITRKRSNLINNYFNLIVKYITDYCIASNIGNIVIGDFSDIKNGINLGKVNNQNFVQIPYGIFKRKLQSKCEQLGIKYHLQDESYTSKCSYVDNEDVKEHITYKGKRIKRGLFKTSKGHLINADVNGAANILVKFLTSNGQLQHPAVANRYGCVNHPARLSLDNLII